jgi:hypothetical protein
MLRVACILGVESGGGSGGGGATKIAHTLYVLYGKNNNAGKNLLCRWGPPVQTRRWQRRRHPGHAV